jgi:1,4-dihydroxy-2-naphthoyl-CoA hydrolase
MNNMIWKTKPTIETLNSFSKGTAIEHLDIAFTEIGDDYLKAEMAVNHKTIQPAGILHGGASVLLAETLGSVASSLCLDDINQGIPVGVEINANHIKSAKPSEVVYGIVTPIHIGRKTHVWDIKIYNQKDQLVCISRLTTMIVAMGA